jgi:hypothetical protein
VIEILAVIAGALLMLLVLAGPDRRCFLTFR